MANSKNSNTGSGTAGGPRSAPPSQLPAASGGGYMWGAVAFALAIGGLVYWKSCQQVETPPPAALAPKPVQTASAELPEFAPPPPPEEPAEEPSAKPTSAPKAGAGKRAGGAAGRCAACGEGTPGPGFAAAVQSTAGTARGCYNRALRTGSAQGRISVRVSVGSDGGVCSVAATSDTLGNPTITNCVLGKFRSRSYPKPKQGCVVANIPINFKMKTQ